MTEKIRGFTTYIGTKIVRALPLSEIEYYSLRGWAIPDKVMREKRKGYLVEYALNEGDAPNHTHYKGYISWSPRAPFEACYRLIGDYDNIEHSPHDASPQRKDLNVTSSQFEDLRNEISNIYEHIKSVDNGKRDIYIASILIERNINRIRSILNGIKE